MSGLLCVYNASGIAQEPERYLLSLRRLAHRGPDGEGVYLRPTIFLGYRHLSVGQAHAGQPPVFRPEKRIAIALDGRIHNREELSTALRGRGYQVEPSDPGVVLDAYAEYGERCFERFRGVWALVLWDERTQQLLVSRDRLGVRPLYYSQWGQNFIIASEIKSILDLDTTSRPMNHRRIRDFVEAGRIDDWSDTFFARIHPAPPGTVLKIVGDRVTPTQYWTLRPVTDPSLTPRVVLERLMSAVELYTPTDVTVGVSLSGGIDSSSIAGILARSPRREIWQVRGFSITPPETTDESFLIDATIRDTGIPHGYVSLDGLDHSRSLARLLDFHDEPIQYSGVFYQFVLRQRMSEAGCRAVLVGYGADEIFGGYEYLALPFLTALLADGRWADSARFVSGAQEFLQTRAWRIMAGALRQWSSPALGWALENLRARATSGRSGSSHTPGGRDSDLLGPLTKGGEGELQPRPPQLDLGRIGQGRAFFRALLDCFRTNIPLIVRLEDRNAMAHGLELCAPFMDHEVVEVALASPFHRYMNGGRNKAILRDAVRDLLAPEVREYRRKLNTPGNDAYVMYDVLGAELLEMLSSESFYASGLWSRACKEAYRIDAARRVRAGRWFRVYMTQKWYERMVRP